MPIGAGPFRLSTYSHSNPYAGCSIRPNPHYYRGEPQIDAVVFQPPSFVPVDQLMTELDEDSGDLELDAASSTEFVVGKIDVARYAPSTNSALDQYIESKGILPLVVYLEPFVLAIALNSSTSPLDNVKLRQAIVRSLTTDGESDSRAPVRLVPKRSSEASRIGNSQVSGPNAPVGDGVDFGTDPLDVLTTYDVPIGELQSALTVISDRLGHEVRLRFLTPSEVASWSPGEYGAVMRVLYGNFIHPVPHNVLARFGTLFLDDQQDGHYATVRSMLEAAAAEPDPQERQEMYLKTEEYVLANALVLPLDAGYATEMAVVQPWVHGFVNPGQGGSVFHNVWFDNTAPERQFP